jgi:hypothetical protein
VRELELARPVDEVRARERLEKVVNGELDKRIRRYAEEPVGRGDELLSREVVEVETTDLEPGLEEVVRMPRAGEADDPAELRDGCRRVPQSRARSSYCGVAGPPGPLLRFWLNQARSLAPDTREERGQWRAGGGATVLQHVLQIDIRPRVPPRKFPPKAP